MAPTREVISATEPDSLLARYTCLVLAFSAKRIVIVLHNSLLKQQTQNRSGIPTRHLSSGPLPVDGNIGQRILDS